MVDAILRWVIVRLWHRRTKPGTLLASAWERRFPGNCLHCGYVRWIRKVHGMPLTVLPHDCVEERQP